MSDIRGILQDYDQGNWRDTFRALIDDRRDREAIRRYGKQNLADAEHYAYARYKVDENPWMFPSLMVATPLYYAGKKTGIIAPDQYTSEPTLDQMGYGILGAWHGLTR